MGNFPDQGALNMNVYLQLFYSSILNAIQKPRFADYSMQLASIPLSHSKWASLIDGFSNASRATLSNESKYG